MRPCRVPCMCTCVQDARIHVCSRDASVTRRPLRPTISPSLQDSFFLHHPFLRRGPRCGLRSPWPSVVDLNVDCDSRTRGRIPADANPQEGTDARGENCHLLGIELIFDRPSSFACMRSPVFFRNASSDANVYMRSRKVHWIDRSSFEREALETRD